MDDPRRSVPRTDVVLADPRLAEALSRLGRPRVKAVVAACLARCRAGEISPDVVVLDVLESLPEVAASMRPVINATGVVVHTNLGRAPLSTAAREAIALAAGATDVELDLDTGTRGRRGRGALEALAAAVPDAEDVLVVNNGAAALSLAVHALASGKEIVLARGEMVEIGDGFRIPELLAASGAVLREVGTTNRARLDDYRAAISSATAFVLKVHPSNFVVRGFTSGVSVGELAGLGVPVVADIGSGLLTHHPRLPDEPDAASTLRAGAGLVTSSGDKLLGGPQAGLILGQAPLVSRLRRHPVARAFRVDKLTLAALEATLRGPVPPVLAALRRDQAGLSARAEAIAASVSGLVDAQPVITSAVVGGGGAPGVELPSAAVSLPAALGAALRTGETAVVGHVSHDRLILDLIAVEPEDDSRLIDAIRLAVKSAAADAE
jgi:L-seryl-tRNA(Ser) seleniumtransferase